MATTRPGLTLRHLVTGVLALGMLVDVASRFLSYDRVVNRGWEAMTRQGPSGRGGVLEPNKRYVSDRAFGDLSSLSNRPWLRQYHREVFTADADGFRKSPGRAGPLVAVMVGSSFTIGSTLSDEETVPAQLSSLIGGTVFNAAGTDIMSESRIDELLDHLHLPPGGTFISEYLEMFDPPLLADRHPPPAGRSALVRRRLGAHYWTVRDALNYLGGWRAPSPFQIELIHAHKALEDDVVLPNTFASLALLEQLRNGDPILFLPRELHTPDRDIGAAAEYARNFAERLAARRLRLLVVLVPTQFTVYAPLLRAPPPRLEGAAYLSRLEEGMRARGISTVNLTKPLQDAAREGLPEHRYVFWRDDTHWNRDGARIAAEQIAHNLSRVDPAKVVDAAPSAPTH